MARKAEIRSKRKGGAPSGRIGAGGKVTGKSSAAAATNVKPLKVKFTLDCQKPVDDNILVVKDLEKFLFNHIKVNGKCKNLGDHVQVATEKAKLYITAEMPFSKRYIKYLTKKYLKKHGLRDFMRVVSSKETVYELRYFQMPQEEEESSS